MRFIKTTSGRYVNVDMIESVAPVKLGKDRWADIRLRDESEERITSHDYVNLFCNGMINSETVTAQPGWFGLSADLTESGIVQIAKEPIVAWRLGTNYTEPVTSSVERGFQGILSPTGEIDTSQRLFHGPNAMVEFAEDFKKLVMMTREMNDWVRSLATSDSD